ncbi:CD63 antigen [Fopius arisanus]|uniref:Tetraspanin n=2 Tax=Fopius arisanus TaxID=64838 RepID=A0A9R1TNE0_9HYME|nr:PREDICTED: CD63 antigen-like [Fopius arisanus]
METCGMSVIKYILFIFNLIFAISGIAIISAGAIVLADVGEFSHFMDGKILGPPVVLIVAGAIVFIIAFLGCYGAIKENYTLLMAFAGAMLLIFIIELSVGIAAAVFRSNFSDVMKESLRYSMKNYSQSESDKMAWDDVQTKLKCCGVESEKDWIEAGVLQPGVLPSSCCTNGDTGNQCLESNVEVYRDGCYLQLKMRVENNARILIGVGIGIAFIELAGIVLACCLAMAIKKDGEQ